VYKRAFQKIDAILPRSLSRSKISPSLQAAWVLRFWPEVFSIVFTKREGSNKVRATTFKNNTLTIECPNTAWMNELRLNQVKIKREINRRLGKNLIVKIRLKLKQDN